MRSLLVLLKASDFMLDYCNRKLTGRRETENEMSALCDSSQGLNLCLIAWVPIPTTGLLTVLELIISLCLQLDISVFLN